MNALHSKFLTLVLAFVLTLVRVHSLSVIPGSPCFDTCNGDTLTSQGDIVCTDSDFTSTDAGNTLSTCLTCLHGSSFQNGFVTDSNLFLYYLSTIQQACLSNSDVTSSCSSQCAPLSASFSNLGGRNQFQSPFSYCSANGNAYFKSAFDCATCLQNKGGSVILGNVVYVGNLGCQTTPSVQDGESIAYPGTLFATTALGSTSSGRAASSSTRGMRSTTTSSSPTGTGALSTTSSGDPGSVTVVLTATLAFTPSATASSTNSSSEKQLASATLSRGVAAGIGIVLGLIGIAAIIAFAIGLRRRLKRKSAVFERMPSPSMTEQCATPPAAGVFRPPVYKPSGTTLGTAAASVFAKAGIGQTKHKEPMASDVEASGALPVNGHSKSIKSVTSRSMRSLTRTMTSKSWRSRDLTPRTSAWFYAANPKKSSDLTALPRPVIVPGMDGIPELPPPSKARSGEVGSDRLRVWAYCTRTGLRGYTRLCRRTQLENREKV